MRACVCVCVCVCVRVYRCTHVSTHTYNTLHMYAQSIHNSRIVGSEMMTMIYVFGVNMSI